MRIAVAGGGVAGSYLACLLSEAHEVAVFERQRRERFKAVCAWGTSKHEMRRLSSRIGLNFDEYILHEGKEMIVKLPRGEEFSIKLKGLCTFDKKRFILDMHERLKVKYDFDVRGAQFSDYNLVVDSTGFHRVLLPKLRRDYFIPTVEYLVKYSNAPFEDFCLIPFAYLGGFIWFFPLSNGLFHVGAGDYFGRHRKALDEFVSKHRGEVMDVLGHPVRISPPKLCEPLVNGNVVGVGESIGAVHPVIGEGIIPGMQCAELFAESLESGLERYPAKVLKHFAVFHDIFQFIRKVHNSTLNYFRDWKLLLSPYFYMKLREERFGMQIRLRDWMRIVNAYRRGDGSTKI
ncbi:MAG: NAD(P)/FAD-dependent oxidoreductase [Nitrososphaerota archaeon]|nr:NAD(P)/FAD-dependent oxidoreductase [Candidatus Calditenuaceae archaeon]MDW8072971.1 NAD(P)/FAD-dependent oxidoreductase [Nitrososphaerota archaeon]